MITSLIRKYWPSLVMESEELRSSEGARLSLIWLELKSRQRRHIWVEFVVVSLLWSEMFFLWVLRFSLPLKNQLFEIPIGPLDVLPLNRYYDNNINNYYYHYHYRYQYHYQFNHHHYYYYYYHYHYHCYCYYSWLPITRTLANSNLSLTRTKIDFPWIFVIHLL